jgi:hypothetical protein
MYISVIAMYMCSVGLQPGARCSIGGHELGFWFALIAIRLLRMTSVG